MQETSVQATLDILCGRLTLTAINTMWNYDIIVILTTLRKFETAV